MDELLPTVGRLALVRRGPMFFITIDGKQRGHGGFVRRKYDCCYRCGETPSYMSDRDRGGPSLCEECLLDIVSAIFMSAEWLLNTGGKRNGQG
jgi:hypothetical protein